MNAISKSMSVDLEKYRILVACIHPGWVKTDMGGKNAHLTPEESTAGILRIICALRSQNSGGLYTYEGKPIPW